MLHFLIIALVAWLHSQLIFVSFTFTFKLYGLHMTYLILNLMTLTLVFSIPTFYNIYTN